MAKQNGIPLDYDLEFKPFLLDPTLDSVPENKRDMYVRKYGKARAGPLETDMVKRGKTVGINL